MIQDHSGRYGQEGLVGALATFYPGLFLDGLVPSQNVGLPSLAHLRSFDSPQPGRPVRSFGELPQSTGLRVSPHPFLPVFWFCQSLG